MGGLVLSLKPYERFLVNGSVLENGPKRGQIRVTGDGVNVLRLSDVIHPEDVNTPLKRVYYAAQLVLSGDSQAEHAEPVVRKGLNDLITVFKNTELEAKLEKALVALKNSRYYSILCVLKPLLPLEQALLNKPIMNAHLKPDAVPISMAKTG